MTTYYYYVKEKNDFDVSKCIRLHAISTFFFPFFLASFGNFNYICTQL